MKFSVSMSLFPPYSLRQVPIFVAEKESPHFFVLWMLNEVTMFQEVPGLRVQNRAYKTRHELMGTASG